MPRFVCAYLPDWQIARHRKAAPSSRHEPFALVAPVSGGWQLMAVDASARSLGLSPGLLLADARARVPQLETAEAEPEKDRAALVRLAYWCTRFSPYTAPWPSSEEDRGSAGITIDVEGCAHLFGGEAGMLAAMHAAFARLDLRVRLALTDSIGAAHALSRCGGKSTIIVPPGAQRDAIKALPVSALRIAPAMAATLSHLGLKCIADLMPLPRAPLTARFGVGLLTRLDQALGLAPESLSPLLPHAPARAQAVLAEPITSQHHVLELAERLAGDLVPVLERDGKGARALTLSLFRIDGEIVRAQIKLAAPSRDPAHIVKLFALKLDALSDAYDAGFGFEAARLDVTAADPLQPSQTGLEDGSAKAREEKLACLTDRLASRLGTENVLRALPRDTHIPERAMALKPALPFRAQRFDDTPRRPLLLLPRAEPAEVTALLPEGPPQQFAWRGVHYRTARAEGPERIAPEWWRDAEGRTRDYYMVEDGTGHRFWMYRDGLYGGAVPPRWFVHGLYP